MERTRTPRARFQIGTKQNRALSTAVPSSNKFGNQFHRTLVVKNTKSVASVLTSPFHALCCSLLRTTSMATSFDNAQQCCVLPEGIIRRLSQAFLCVGLAANAYAADSGPPLSRCQCNYDKWVGTCIATASRKGDWVRLTSNTQQCSRVDW